MANIQIHYFHTEKSYFSLQNNVNSCTDLGGGGERSIPPPPFAKFNFFKLHYNKNMPWNPPW